MAVTLNTAQSVSHASADPASGENFKNFHPTGAVMYRDGGSIEVTGTLNRSVNARIFFDQGMGSETKGQFFVQTKFWAGPDWSERRPMTGSEMSDLQAAMERLDRPNDPNARLYESFTRGLVTAAQPSAAPSSTDPREDSAFEG
jgi:hypothetical protein